MLSLHTETLRPYATMIVAPAPADWRAEALESYRRAEREETAALRADLAARVASLTGVALDPVQLIVEPAARQATAFVDGVQFRLRAGKLTIIRPCQVCDVGAFASPAVRSRADLGYALEVWEPRCPSCGPDDQEDWSYSW